MQLPVSGQKNIISELRITVSDFQYKKSGCEITLTRKQKSFRL
jgi:hypothetical protein